MNDDGRGNPMGDEQATRSVGPILTSWMGHVAPERAPERLFEAAFARTMSISQRRAYPWHRWNRDRPESDRRSRNLMFAGVVAVLVVAIGIGLVPRLRNDGVGGPSPSPSSPPSVSPQPSASPTGTPLPSLPPAETIEPTAAIPVDQPVGMASDGTSVWLFTAAGKLVRIDPVTNTIGASVDLPRPTNAYQGLSGDAAGLWLTDWDADVLSRFDPQTLRFVGDTAVDSKSKGVLAVPSGLWIANTRGGTVTRIDPSGVAETIAISVGPAVPSGPNWLAEGLGSIWVDVPNIAAVARINESTGVVEATIRVPGPATPCGGLGVGPDAVWVSSCDGGNLVARIDPVTNTPAGTVDLRGRGYTIAMIDGRPWVSVVGGQLVRIDPATNLIDRVVAPGSGFSGGGDVVIAADSLWVVDAVANQVLRLPIAALAG
jgi:streptogramin lyase